MFLPYSDTQQARKGGALRPGVLWGAVMRDTVVRGEPVEEGSHRDMPPTPRATGCSHFPGGRVGTAMKARNRPDGA